MLNTTLDGTHRFTSDDEEYETWLEEYKDAVKAAEESEEAEETEEAEGSEDEGGTESEGEGE